MGADLDLHDVSATSPLAKEQLRALWETLAYLMAYAHVDIRDAAQQLLRNAGLQDPQEDKHG